MQGEGVRSNGAFAFIFFLVLDAARTAAGVPVSLLKAEAAARQAAESPQAAEEASNACYAVGLVLRGVEWSTEALRRNIVLSGGTDQQQLLAMRYALVAMSQNLEMHAVQLGRGMLRSGSEQYLKEIKGECGGETDAFRALVAAVFADDGGGIPRNVSTAMLAQCAVEQKVIEMLLANRSDATITLGGYNLLHFLAFFGDGLLMNATLAALPKKTLKRLLRGTDPVNRTPFTLAAGRGHAAIAHVLAEAMVRTKGQHPAWPTEACPGSGCQSGQLKFGEASDTCSQSDLNCDANAFDDGGWGTIATQRVDGCDFAVEASSLTSADFQRKYQLRDLPVLVRNGSSHQWAQLRKLLRPSAFSKRKDNVKVSSVPYHDGVKARSTSLADFAERVASGIAGDEYLFLSLQHGNPLRTKIGAHFPRFVTGSQPEERQVQLALGGAGSGAPPHYHKAAVNTLIYGLKRWWLFPPRDAIYSKVPASRWAAADVGGPAWLAQRGHTMLECVQRPGDVIFVPDFWGHAVLNIQPSVAVASEFATPRNLFELQD